MVRLSPATTVCPSPSHHFSSHRRPAVAGQQHPSAAGHSINHQPWWIHTEQPSLSWLTLAQNHRDDGFTSNFIPPPILGSNMAQPQTLELSQSPVVDVAHFHSLLPPLLDGNNNGPRRRRVYLIRHGETDWNLLYKIQGGYDMPLNANGIRQANAVANLFVVQGEEEEGSRCTKQPRSRMIVPVDLVASSHLERAHATADVVWKACCEAHRRPEEEEVVHPPILPMSLSTTATSTTTTPISRVVYPGLSEMRFGCLEGLSRDKNYIPPTDDANDERQPSHDRLLELYKHVSLQMRTDLTLPWPGGGESQVDVQTRSLAAFYDILDAHPDKRHIVMVSHGRTNRVLLASLLCRLKKDERKIDDVDAAVKENYNNEMNSRRRTPQQLDPTDFLQTQREIKQGSTYLVYIPIMLQPFVGLSFFRNSALYIMTTFSTLLLQLSLTVVVAVVDVAWSLIRLAPVWTTIMHGGSFC
jgi:broad specificity phosphatase PhoE